MGKLDALRSNRNTLQQDVQDARIKLMEIEKGKEGLEDRIQTFSEQDKELGERIVKYESDLKRLGSENKRLATSISEAEKKLKELSRSQETTSLEKDKLESEYNKTYGELQRLQSGIRERQKRKDEYHDTLRGYELRLADGENDMKRHRQRILDLYHEDLQETTLNLEDFDLSSKKLQIDKIKRSLERIGPVNMAVKDEYEHESERYDFLTQQYGDLEESVKTLKETID
ncbi:MAG: hypothetical protein QGH27_10330, partial [SAR324 cluster bacterium]|nr:hypothetical protein [SAR324 cluster bacterium]